MGVPDESRVAAVLRDAWEESLSTTVTDETDFFRSGGDSLAVIHMARALKEGFPDLEEPEDYLMETLFGTSTFGGMLRHLQQHLTRATSGGSERLDGTMGQHCQ